MLDTSRVNAAIGWCGRLVVAGRFEPSAFAAGPAAAMRVVYHERMAALASGCEKRKQVHRCPLTEETCLGSPAVAVSSSGTARQR
jgi:hypothetical protein